jgi:ribonuclease-3
MTEADKIKDLFKDPKLYEHALTHRSWLNEHKGVRTSNERLEFLGDAILEFVVSQEIFKKFPDKEEGYLTALRANLVNTTALAEFAKKINLGQSIFLSKGEEESGGRTNISILADTVEAVIGALYIDQGLSASADFVSKNLLINLDDKASQPLKDPKSRLQEYAQSKGYDAPRYKVISQTGPDHNKKFIIEVSVKGMPWGRGEGRSKSTAEQAAATDALNLKLIS